MVVVAHDSHRLSIVSIHAARDISSSVYFRKVIYGNRDTAWPMIIPAEPGYHLVHAVGLVDGPAAADPCGTLREPAVAGVGRRKGSKIG